MRQLAVKVGSDFADAPGVAQAKLDESAFVKLFTTLVHRESNFRPRAVSPAGARGLGQLMPATARELGVKDTFAPEENLVGAATYLTDMLDQFGSPELALAAYNAGPNAVAKYGGIPPYRETRQYVADIFHEVLREPVTIEEQPQLTDVARRGLAALAFETVSAETGGDPFDLVLTEKPDRPRQHHDSALLAFAGNAEAATVTEGSFNLAPAETKAEPGLDKTAQAAKKSDMPEGHALDRDGNPTPDLSSLPKPREFGQRLTKSQLAMRELVIDTALRHAKAPGVAKAGLSEESFVTLFVALIRRQSSFNRQAVSPDGAKGLGQLTPDTARTLGLKDLFAAEGNLDAAASRLTRLLDQFGSTTLALAAYNIGENALTDRTTIPQIRGTRQLIADVLYDLKNEPRPDFVLAKFQTARLAVAPMAVERAQNRAPAGSAGIETVLAGDSVVVQVGAGASVLPPAPADASLFSELLAALHWVVGEVTGLLQVLFSGAPQNAVHDVRFEHLWHAVASNGTSVADNVTVAAAPTPTNDNTLPPFDVVAVFGAAGSGPALPPLRQPPGSRNGRMLRRTGSDAAGRSRTEISQNHDS